MNTNVVVPVDVIEPKEFELVEVGKLHAEDELGLDDVVHRLGDGVVDGSTREYG